MSATATTEMKVEIDGAIRANPNLYEAVRAAQLYFDGQYFDEPTNEDPNRTAEMRWEQSLEGGPVRVELSERDILGSRIVDTRLTPKQLLDDVNRDVSMIRLLRSLLRKRSAQRMVRLDRLISELEAQEARDANAD